MTEIELKQLVTFCILMQNGEGIISKAPSYIEEKYNFCMACPKEEWLSHILDDSNRAKFSEYCEKWIIDKEMA